ncbi:MAG: hypothetical protein O2968_01370, partial [Acidobacteria bacterium]|nr:hypothetical protein [Acidobacteriota bacterium]
MADVASRVLVQPATVEEVEHFAKLERDLYTAVISDALDSMGIREQAMDGRLRPLDPSFRCLGRARTIACSDVYHESSDPYQPVAEYPVFRRREAAGWPAAR